MYDTCYELDEEIRKAGRKKIDKKKLNSIINKIEKENSKFLKKNKEVLKGVIPNEKNKVEIGKTNEKNDDDNEEKDEVFNKEKEDQEIEIDIEQFSVVKKTKNCCIKFFYCLLPYKSHLKIIKANYNTSVLLVFKIYRFLVLMSYFALLIFLFECIYHFFKIKNNLKQICKYGLPCLFQYSSFISNEALVYSITYGIWLIIFSISSIAYYFVLSSEQEEQEIYFQNNKNMLASSYLTSSWNFNYKNEEISFKSKEAIHNELKLYAKSFLDKLDENKSRTYKPIYMAFSHILYVLYIFLHFSLFFFVFFIRDLIRNNKKAIKKMELNDILADLVSFLLFAIFFHISEGITSIFPKYEGWKFEKHKNISDAIKKMINLFVGIFTLLHIYTYFTLYTNDFKDKNIPFFGKNSLTFFGCPGLYVDKRHNFNEYNKELYTNELKASTLSYSRCREEEVGINFLFIFLFYFISTFDIELFKNCFNCICNEKPLFEPVRSMIQVFTSIILYLIAMFYIPYLALFFFLITNAIYKFQFYLLNHKGSYSFKETGITKRNNTKILLLIYFILTIEIIIFQGYFYLLSYPHSYKMNCFLQEGAESSELFYDFDRDRCGPVMPFVRVSELFTELMLDLPILGWIVGIIHEMPFLIIVLGLIFIIILYRKYNPDSRYYEYLIKRQKELDNNFQIFYEQISKRDSLTSMLLKVTKQEK